MDGRSWVIDGEHVVVRPAARMEDTLQAFAIRAACFIGEQNLSFSEEFDGHDHDACHLIAYLGNEPIRAAAPVQVLCNARPPRGRSAFPRPRRRRPVDRARAVAESRGRLMLYVRATPPWARYFERLGWRLLEETPGANATVALVHPTDPARARIDLDTAETHALSAQYAGDTVVTAPVASPG